MTDWQKIETAPRDGTWILIWTGSCHDIGFWHDGAWVSDYMAIAATHWMPLPKPPA